MNAIYKVIWNDAIRQYQVVNELCRSRRKACSVKAVHTDGAGRSLKRSVLATAAATLIGSAAILGVPGSVWADDFNLGDYAPDIEINIGTGAVNNGEPPKVDFSLLPGSNETIYINQSAFTGFASNIFNQEERTPPLYLLETTDSGAMVSDINLSILGADGQPLDLTNNHLGTTGTADFYYTFDNTRIVDGFLYVYRTLNRIDLTSQAGYGQVFDVSDSKGADLKAAITGEGNITFSYNSTGEGGDPGHLTLSNPDNANAYTGRTFVGYNSQGDESSPVNIYFGKDGALGSTIGTEQLQIAAQSAVHFGGENDNEAYTQTVRGLSGSGLLHLGTQATLTLNQSSDDTGLVIAPTQDEPGQIIVANKVAGTGTYNPEDGTYTSGAVFNVNLSGEVSDYELVFTDNGSGYTGLINLTNASVTAYDPNHTVSVGGQTYTPNALLESATLQLLNDGHLRVDGKGSVHNLIISDANSSIVFDNLDLGDGILEIDNLSLNNTGKVEIDNIGSGLQGDADALGFLEADDGITEAIIHVSGSIAGSGHGMVLTGDVLKEKQTELSNSEVEADLYWNFDSDLIFDAEDKTYSANYGLTRVDVQSGQFALEAKEGATGATADFTAQITGSGGLRIDASGTTVTLGNTEQGAPANSYSGATTVTSGTDVILAVDNAMGNTSSLDADGNVTLTKEVDQTIKGLTGSGTLTLEDDSVLTLAQSGDAILDNVLSGNGTFRVSGTGTDKTNVVFNKEFGYDGAFDFSNTVFDLDEGHNRDASASADFNLSNSVLHLGESGGTFGNMVVNDGVQFDSAYLVIGSDTAALSGTGSLTFNSNTSIKLEGISVADDIALIDFDENTRYQDFITASGGITGSGNVTNNGTIYVGNKNSSGDTPADSNYIGNELVIEGDYITDGGTLDLNAIIAGKDNSKSDHVTIKGEIDGTGFIDVNYDSSVSTGGELEYLGLVSVAEGESGDSLKLKDTIKIGDLWYRLMWSSDQNEYYLQSSVTDPGDKPWDTEDVENVNAGTRSALAFMQAQAFDLSLRGHLGETLYVDPVTGEQRKSSFWMVQRGDWTKFSNASGQMDADGNLYTTHLGTDLFKRETDGATFRWGVLAGFADGDFDVSSNVDGKSSKGSFRGYSAGLYMTAESKAESGPFLGLQLRWNRFDSELGQDDYDVNGLSLTAEASWDQLLSKGITDGGRNYEWRLEPHVRAYWTNFGDPDDWTSSLGETYSSDFDNGLLVRVGARTKIQTTLGTGPAWQAYAEANWVYNNGDYSTTMSTKYGDVTSTQNGAEFAEFRLGLEAQFTTNVNVWLEGHHQTGSDDYESTGAMFGFKYMW